jgi:hypothetical protein
MINSLRLGHQRTVVHIWVTGGSTETKFTDDVLKVQPNEKEMGMQDAHISALANKHADLEARIDQETHRPQPDMTAIARLKKEKLKLKDEMLGN